MTIELTETNASQIASAPLASAPKAAGSPAMGMVLTLVVVTDEGNHYDALKPPTRVAGAPVARHRRHPAGCAWRRQTWTPRSRSARGRRRVDPAAHVR